MQKIVYVFDCPVHGQGQDQIFCFRAADPALINRWKSYEVTRIEVPILREAMKEIREIQSQLSGPREGICRT